MIRALALGPAVVGGVGNGTTKSVEEYDPDTNSWTAKAPMNIARSSHQIAVVNGKIYAISGGNSDNDGLPVNSVEEYDPIKNQWVTKASMSIGRGQHQVAIINDKIYVIGGQSSGTNYLSSVEAYDISTDT
jgi:N-acetylneuraminic acid mutarotase